MARGLDEQSALSNALLLWGNAIARKGLRRPLQLEDLPGPPEAIVDGGGLHEQAEACWEEEQRKAAEEKRPARLFKSVWVPVARGKFMHGLYLSAFSGVIAGFGRPFLLRLMIREVCGLVGPRGAAATLARTRLPTPPACPPARASSPAPSSCPQPLARAAQVQTGEHGTEYGIGVLSALTVAMWLENWCRNHGQLHGGFLAAQWYVTATVHLMMRKAMRLRVGAAEGGIEASLVGGDLIARIDLPAGQLLPDALHVARHADDDRRRGVAADDGARRDLRPTVRKRPPLPPTPPPRHPRHSTPSLAPPRLLLSQVPRPDGRVRARGEGGQAAREQREQPGAHHS